MIRTFRITSLSIASCLAVSTGLQAQGSGLIFESLEPRAIGMQHLAQSSATLGACIGGDLTGDLHMDSFSMLGSRPLFAYGPGLYESVADWPADVSSMAFAAGFGLATTSERGLECWTFDSLTAGFQTTAVESTHWVQAHDIQLADMTGDGALDAVGVQSSGLGLVRCADLGGVAASSQWPLGQTVYDLALVEWDGSPGLELAVSGSTALMVLEADGTTLASFAPLSAQDRIACLGSTLSGTSRLALLTTATSGVQSLEVLSPGGPSAALVLGSLSAYGLVTADFDGDGNDDAALSMHSTGQILVLRTSAGQAPLHSFAPGDFAWVGPETPRGGVDAIPAAQDFDNDGDVDLMIPDDSARSLHLVRNATVDHRQLLPVSSGGSYRWVGQNPDLELLLNVDAPPTLESAQLRLEVQVWRRQNAAAFTDQESLHSSLVNLSTESVLVLSPTETFLATYKIYCVELRMVELDAAGDVVRAWPADVVAVGEEVAVSPLADDHGVDIEDFATFLFEGNGLGSGVGDLPIGCVPCHVPDDLPKPKGR